LSSFRFPDSDYPFGIFKLLLVHACSTYSILFRKITTSTNINNYTEMRREWNNRGIDSHW